LGGRVLQTERLIAFLTGNGVGGFNLFAITSCTKSHNGRYNRPKSINGQKIHWSEEGA